MKIPEHRIEERRRYVEEAKHALFQDAVFLIFYFNNEVKHWGPPPRLDDIEPKEIFEQFDEAEYNNAILNAGKLWLIG